jgi:hypothetical protein
MNPVQEYLRLSSAYCQYLGGLRWSSSDDTLVYADERTFAFNPEIASFLEGFGRQRPLIHFGHILHLLDLLRNSRKLSAREPVRLHAAYSTMFTSIANAGAFFAALCRKVPDLPMVVDVRDVCERLRHPSMPIRWFIVSFHDTFHPTLGAPLEPEDFEAWVLQAVAAYSDAELRHWFRHGQGVVKETGAEIARQMAPPRTLGGVLAALLERPRLAGAQAFVPQLVSALALPPRRLARQELPVGGYADVTTHGRPEQILIGQFALDEEDFFRRFADRELLYYRREEPQARPRQDLVILLDQGVRTWGDVRLVLTAAALAYGKQAARRKMPFYLAATSREGALIDPLASDSEELGRIVEASDLSANPGLVLESVLEQHGEGDRDVVLLTHPRNLRELDVRAAARRVKPGVRLFAVALDAAGSVDLVEMRHGAPVPVRHFQISRPTVPMRPAVKKPDYPVEPASPWTGDVEPIGFPFRFGVGNPIIYFDFDYAGNWLVTASVDGMLHAYRTSDGESEALPRGFWQSQLLDGPWNLTGVRCGFVVVGHIARRPVAFHYDFTRRTCKAYPFAEPGLGEVNTQYWSEQHTLFVFMLECATTAILDLTTGQVSYKRFRDRTQAYIAWSNWQPSELPGHRVWSVMAPSSANDAPLACWIDSETGEVHLPALPAWRSFIPLADGLPALRYWVAEQFQCRRQTLALLTSCSMLRKEKVLRLFRGPAGRPLASYPMRAARHLFTLSEDGEHLVRLVGEYWVEVNRVGDDNRLIFSTRAGGFSSRLRFVLGESWLFLATTKNHRHLVRWFRKGVERLSWHNKEAGVNQDAYYFTKPPDRTRVESTQKGVPALGEYDRERFVLGASLYVMAIADRFGQVAIFDVDQQLICMFFAFRERIAAWMPDGTRLGPASLTGGPETPDAATKIGEALSQACERGRKRR